jgi:hypothetical protein
VVTTLIIRGIPYENQAKQNNKTNMNEKVKRVKEIAEELRTLFGPDSINFDVNDSEIRLTYHGNKFYADAVAWFRELGVQKREKHVFDTYTYIKGEVDGVLFCTYPDELPPTCRKVEVIERVPRTQTVDTGEFIEIKRTKIVCGNEDE